MGKNGTSNRFTMRKQKNPLFPGAFMLRFLWQQMRHKARDKHTPWTIPLLQQLLELPRQQAHFLGARTPFAP